ncbi:hypothetical protein VCRA2119O147_1720007 [Vibrio crassostreae]|nr:hypothetical protein VCRA2113O222_10198 [Vibrio crassostreae]CAK1833574.1 hypothetical protein VCRA2119O245_10201 [Vibrio crassostreae]CAK2295353.1 hypothetical protein VCRA2119O147_1720007 [Vibrio crassostreae]CAK2635373.1 hypothetical protein VCRA2119O146_140089 [Vibrio crassostreae]CAK2710123.1 hypothetical protein VCRA2118O237_10197 [Vibrio crassostreae]
MGMKNKINRMITHQINPIFFVVKSVRNRKHQALVTVRFMKLRF